MLMDLKNQVSWRRGLVFFYFNNPTIRFGYEKNRNILMVIILLSRLCHWLQIAIAI